MNDSDTARQRAERELAADGIGEPWERLEALARDVLAALERVDSLEAENANLRGLLRGGSEAVGAPPKQTWGTTGANPVSQPFGTPQARVAEGNKLSKKGEAYWASLEYKAAALSALDECKRLRKLLWAALHRRSAHQVWLEQENERLQKRVDALTEAIASAMTSLATGPGEDGYADAVLAAAVGVPPEQTP